MRSHTLDPLVIQVCATFMRAVIPCGADGDGGDSVGGHFGRGGGRRTCCSLPFCCCCCCCCCCCASLCCWWSTSQAALRVTRPQMASKFVTEALLRVGSREGSREGFS